MSDELGETMTEEKMPVDLTGFRCPNCDAPTDDTTSMSMDPDAQPKDGDVSFCFECGTALRITTSGLELIPDEELEELRKDSRFARAEILGRVLALVQRMPDDLVPPPEITELEDVEEGPDTITVEHGDHTHTVPRVPGGLPVIIEGDSVRLIGGPELPKGMQDLIRDAIRRQRTERQAREVKKYVTPEVANHVLSIYGDEEASMPSLATAGLISLIRTCAISDEDMLESLNQVPEFHGYVLAVMLLAEPSLDLANPDMKGGMKILREFAGLDPVEAKDE